MLLAVLAADCGAAGLSQRTLEYLDSHRSRVNGMLESARGSSRYSYDPMSGSFILESKGVLDSQAFTYEGALAIIAYLLLDRPEDARQMLATYRKEFYRQKGDSVGLFTSYKGDKQELSLGLDGDRIHLGPVMWVSIAAMQYASFTGDDSAIGYVLDTVRWARQLTHYGFKDKEKGAACMGYGWGPDWSRVYSTENNVDYYAVLYMLKQAYKNGGEKMRAVFASKHIGLRELDVEMAGILRWLKDVVYEPGSGMFCRGYNEKGLDTIKALDTVSWPIAGLGPELLTQMRIDPFRLVKFAEDYLKVSVTVEGEKFEGFDFTELGSRGTGIKMIWLEGTGQQIVAYRVMADYAARTGRDGLSKEYRRKAEYYTGQLEKLAQKVKLQHKALPYTSYRPGEKELVMTFVDEWEIPRGAGGRWIDSAASTLWYYFAAEGFNPLRAK